ncbi:hypothetical protein H4R34_000495 [Dimargaris verticillata]|uniref:Spindle pole body component n=1 Tax=Dimargaris verticillata TaxID=2761393 RepID=A0A9W8B635_9FUNG|nr:hypothetical protein H4R34_000495 [Dimargaris verticillata]
MPQPAQTTLTWTDIVRDDPLIGDHWATEDDAWCTASVTSDDDALVSSSSRSSSPTSPDLWWANESLVPSPVHSTSTYEAMNSKSSATADSKRAFQALSNGCYWTGTNQCRTATGLPRTRFDPANPLSLAPALCTWANQHHELVTTDRLGRYYTEVELVREVVQLLLGRPCAIATQDPQGKCTWLPSVRLRHLSPGCLRHVLASIEWYHTCLVYLRTTFRNHLGSAASSTLTMPSSQVAQALAHQLRTALAPVDALLVLIDTAFFATQAEASTCTSLLDLCGRLQGYAPLLSLLNSVCRQIWPASVENPPPATAAALTTRILDVLWDTLTAIQLECQPDLFALALRLFVAAVVPYTRMLQRWATTGTLADPCNEFAIGCVPDRECGGPMAVDAVLRDDCPVIVRPYMAAVAALGLEVNLFQLVLTQSSSSAPSQMASIPCLADQLHDALLGMLGTLSHFAESPAHKKFRPASPTLPMPFGTELPDLCNSMFLPEVEDLATLHAMPTLPVDLKPTTLPCATVCYQPLTPVSAVVYRILNQYLRCLKQAIGPQIQRVFRHHTPWDQTFARLHHLYFMFDGTILDYFCDQWFDELVQCSSLTPAGPQLLGALNTRLSESLHQHPEWQGEVKAVRLTGSVAWLHSQPLAPTLRTLSPFLDALTLDYDLPCILKGFFSPHSQRCYQRIHRFLLLVRFYRSLLHRIELVKPPRLGPVGTYREAWSLRRQRLRGQQRTMRQFQPFYALRAQLQAFVHGLWHYLLVAVLQPEYQAMTCRVTAWLACPEYLVSVTEIVAYLDAYTDRLVQRCLLDAKTAVLHKHLQAALDTIPTFYRLFTSFSQLLSQSEITAVPTATTDPPPAPLPSTATILQELTRVTDEFRRTSAFLTNVLQITARTPLFHSLEALALTVAEPVALHSQPQTTTGATKP